MVRGWVYVITNRVMSELVKIGFSERDPLVRASKLAAGTEVPFPYEVIYDVLVYSPYVVEQRVHKNLSEVRAGKEWFTCDWLKAASSVRETAEELGEILAEKEYEPLIQLRKRRIQEQREAQRLQRERDLNELQLRKDAERKQRLQQTREVAAMHLAHLDGEASENRHVDVTRVVICPKCYSVVKTDGRPPPYFCIPCGNRFSAGI